MINIPKGTKDLLPSEAYKTQYIESQARETARLFGFKEIRTPVFEHTELFLRGVGETTDIVNKEMYTFEDKGGRSITLKPEGTAGVVRSFIENSLFALPQPFKAFYISPIFRYERPQSGRLRQHHQFGVELFGSIEPLADAEVISLAKTLFDRLGLDKLTLYINSMGCKDCRADYNRALVAYFEPRLAALCPTCRDRYLKNPLRILDCKEDACKKIGENAPKITDYLCGDCKTHFEGVKAALKDLSIAFEVNPRIVRGLDYYTNTVFEFVSSDIGAQGTVCGGGRYNGLVESLGGKPTAAVGFGLGIERLLLTLENCGRLKGFSDTGADVYVAPAGAEQYPYAARLVYELRLHGVAAATDLMARSLKAQMKYADKNGAAAVLVIGEDEIKNNAAEVKFLGDGSVEKIKLDEAVKYFFKRKINNE